MNISKSIGYAFAGLALVWCCAAQAQDAAATEYVPGSDTLKAPPPEREDGWHPALTLGANLNLASNANFVGQVDGFSLLVGANIIGELRLIDGKHDWKNTISLNETWAKTPVIDEFLKSNDLLDVESLYRFFAFAWGGPYARLNLQTPLFSAQSITAEPQTYVLEGQDPVANGVLTDRFELANPFEPLTINESVGMFADPVTGPHLNVSLRAGFGGRHTFANGVRLITSDDHAGLRAALQARFSGVPWQRCQFHLAKNLFDHLPPNVSQEEASADLRAVFNAPNRSEAERLLGLMVSKHAPTAKKLAAWLEQNVPEGLTVFDFPADHRRRLRTNNGLERLNREIKRRTRVASIFPNEASLLRLATAVLMETDDEWQTEKRYLPKATA